MIKRILMVILFVLSVGLCELPYTNYYLSGYFENLFIPDVYNARSIGMGNTHILINGNFMANPALTSKNQRISSTCKVKYGSRDYSNEIDPYFNENYESYYLNQYNIHNISLSGSIPLDYNDFKFGYGVGFNTLYDWAVKSEENTLYVGYPRTNTFQSEGGIQVLNVALSIELLERIVFGIGYNSSFWFKHSYKRATEDESIYGSTNVIVDYSAQILQYGLYIQLPFHLNIAIVHHPSSKWKMTKKKTTSNNLYNISVSSKELDTGYKLPEITSFGVSIQTIPNLILNLSQTILPYSDIGFLNVNGGIDNLYDGKMTNFGFEYDFRGVKIRGGKYLQDLIIPQDDERHDVMYSPYGHTVGLGYTIKSFTIDIGYDKNYWQVNQYNFHLTESWDEEVTHSKIVLSLNFNFES